MAGRAYARSLYRVSFGPDPLSFPPWVYVGDARYDDPRRPAEYRVVYLGESLRCCFLETLVDLRPKTSVLAALRAMGPGSDPHDPSLSGFDLGAWRKERMIGRCRVALPPMYLDLREVDVREWVRRELAVELNRLGVGDLLVPDVLARRTDVTQTVSRWAFERGYEAILYHSCVDARESAWAIFERDADPSRPDPDTRRSSLLLDPFDIRQVMGKERALVRVLREFEMI